MARSRHLIFLGLLSICLLGLVGCAAGERHADPTTTPPSTAPTPSSDFSTLTVEVDFDDEGPRARQRFTLRCLPDRATGSVPDPQLACALLAGQGAAFLTEDPPTDEPCAAVWGGPGTVEISGSLAGVSVSRTITRADGCEIARWQVLVSIGLLPDTGESPLE